MFKWKKYIQLVNRRTRYIILIIAVFTILLLGVQIIWLYERKESPVYTVRRPEQGEALLPVKVYAEGEEQPSDSVLKILPRAYTQEERDELFEEAYEQILIVMLAGNESLEAVNSDLNLVTELRGKPLTIQWFSDNYNLINYDGKVNNAQIKQGEYENVMLTAVFEYETFQRIYEIDVKVVSMELSGSGRFWQQVQEEIQQALNAAPEQECIELPDTVSGKRVKYVIEQENASPAMTVFLGVLGIAAVLAGNQYQRRKDMEHRKGQLQFDYSEMISKLTLLIGAGMTVCGAWDKIVRDYQNQKKFIKGKAVRYVYEEMSNSLNEIKAGVSEWIVYERFGKRCDTKEYLKFSALLVQNLKKGTKNLTQMLELEAKDAFENRKNITKKLGEQAGTKLLLPMIMMLVVVMIIILVPAMTTFGI